MIPYIIKAKKNPQNKDVKYYAQIAPVKYVRLDNITERISEKCTVTEHDVKAVLSALQMCVVKYITDGRTVRLGDLGSFRATLKGKPCETKEEVKASKIERVRVRYTMSARLSQVFGNKEMLQFEKVGEAETAEDKGE